jgi:hypothetical protein
MAKKKSLQEKFRTDNRAVSPAMSMVIIVAVTTLLVIVTSSYAFQVLDRQRGASEFDAVKKSVTTFDDALRSIAWNLDGTRSARFTLSYGHLDLVPNALPLAVNVTGYPVNYSANTGYVQYSISSNYVTFGAQYQSYLIGDNRSVVSASTDPFGQAVITQGNAIVSILLDYRVRALRTSVVNVSGTLVNYVDIMIIKTNATRSTLQTSDFDLIARNVGIVTDSRGPYTVVSSQCNISVTLGGMTNLVTIDLEPGNVVFNFVIANVQVST